MIISASLPFQQLVVSSVTHVYDQDILLLLFAAANTQNRILKPLIKDYMLSHESLIYSFDKFI